MAVLVADHALEVDRPGRGSGRVVVERPAGVEGHAPAGRAVGLEEADHAAAAARELAHHVARERADPRRVALPGDVEVRAARADVAGLARVAAPVAVPLAPPLRARLPHRQRRTRGTGPVRFGRRVVVRLGVAEVVQDADVALAEIQIVTDDRVGSALDGEEQRRDRCEPNRRRQHDLDEVELHVRTPRCMLSPSGGTARGAEALRGGRSEDSRSPASSASHTPTAGPTSAGPPSRIHVARCCQA